MPKLSTMRTVEPSQILTPKDFSISSMLSGELENEPQAAIKKRGKRGATSFDCHLTCVACRRVSAIGRERPFAANLDGMAGNDRLRTSGHCALLCVRPSFQLGSYERQHPKAHGPINVAVQAFIAI